MLCAALLAASAFSADAESGAESGGDRSLTLALNLFAADNKRRQALRAIRGTGDTGMVAPMIISLRYLPPEARAEVVPVLQRITGHRGIGDDWFRWMVWQEEHPEISPFAGFVQFQHRLYTKIDPAFAVFFEPGSGSVIRREEVTWGGVKKDGIPALDQPAFIAASAADYLQPEDRVFGVAIGDDIRAYPYRILDWHEMANDVVGGIPVALAYCTLCGSGVLYRTDAVAEGPLKFGSSGFLYRSNKLMYDQQTHSLWNQLSGEPAIGALVGSGLSLEVLPMVTTTWAAWQARHPRTRVLDPNTGYERQYGKSGPYHRYFKSSQLMFPAALDEVEGRAKSIVFALRLTGARKAWPLEDFEGGAVINDRVGVIPVVLVGEASTSSVRAYRGDGRGFALAADGLHQIQADDELWQVREDGLQGPDGALFPRLPGHLSYRFAWQSFLGGPEAPASEHPAPGSASCR